MLAFGVMSVLLSMSIIGVSLLLIGLVLLQKNRGSGLSGAFGGVGGHSAFGTKTGDFLTWITVGLVAVFLLLTVVANFAFEPEKMKPRSPVDAATPGTSDIPVNIPASPESPDGSPAGPTPIELPASTTPSPAPATPAAGEAAPTAGDAAPATGESAPTGSGEVPPASN